MSNAIVEKYILFENLKIRIEKGEEVTSLMPFNSMYKTLFDHVHFPLKLPVFVFSTEFLKFAFKQS